MGKERKVRERRKGEREEGEEGVILNYHSEMERRNQFKSYVFPVNTSPTIHVVVLSPDRSLRGIARTTCHVSFVTNNFHAHNDTTQRTTQLHTYIHTNIT